MDAASPFTARLLPSYFSKYQAHPRVAPRSGRPFAGLLEAVNRIALSIPRTHGLLYEDRGLRNHRPARGSVSTAKGPSWRPFGLDRR